MKLYGGNPNKKKRAASKATPTQHTKPNEIRRTQPPKAAQPQPVKKQKKKGKGRRIAAVFVGVLALLTVTGFALWKAFVVPPDLEPVSTPKPTQSAKPGIETPTPTKKPQETPAEETDNGRKKGVWTFLVVGKDQGNGNTDTILVGMIDTEGKSLDVISIPRDTLVNVSWKVKKVNSIYSATGGIDGLIDGIKDLIGYKVDCYAEVDMTAFKRLVDTIGGVYYDVPIDMHYDDPTQDLHIHINKGHQWLSGEDALKVVRFRDGNNGSGYKNGDIGRIATQQDFLKSVAKQMLTLGNIPNLNEFAKIYEENVDTNLTAGNVVWFAKEFLKLSADDIRFHTVPGDYSCSIKGGSYVSIYIDEWIEMINAFINPYKDKITVDHLDILTKDASGNLYATSGSIAGGVNSFYDYRAASGNNGNGNTPAAPTPTQKPQSSEPPQTTPAPEMPPIETPDPGPGSGSGDNSQDSGLIPA